MLTSADRVRSGRQDRYQLVLLLLVTSYLLSALFTGARARVVILVLYVAALLLALRSPAVSPTAASWLRWTLVLGSVGAGVILVVATARIAQGLVALWLAVILLSTVVVLVRRVLYHHVVTLQTIFGALSAYLLIGFAFAALFSAVARLSTEPFFAGGQRANLPNLQYFSFVTLTTTGYGDLTAGTTAGRALAVMEALVGQIFLVTLVARLVSLFGTARAQPRIADDHARTSSPQGEAGHGRPT